MSVRRVASVVDERAYIEICMICFVGLSDFCRWGELFS